VLSSPIGWAFARGLMAMLHSPTCMRQYNMQCADGKHQKRGGLLRPFMLATEAAAF
jgi:hypothetical protein